MDDNRKKALAAALGQIEKQFGKGSVMRLGDNQAARDIAAVSTGSIGLDVALGIGGVPKGRVVEIYGPESSGKTTSMPSTRSTRPTPRSSASTSMNSWCRNPIRANRRSRSRTCWCAPAPSTSSSSTRSRR